VDLISYEICQIKPHLELKELVPGKGETQYVLIDSWLTEKKAAWLDLWD
jgi:hypothetical protein